MKLPSAKQPENSATTPQSEGRLTVLTLTAWHSVSWLLVSNFIGLLIATLLLFPSLNNFLGEWTYGHWLPLHLNLNLFGWGSLPLVAWLFKVYQVDRPPAARWSRATLWGWATALAVGAFSWLTGHSSGKLFLDWQGYARMLFVLATFFLWLVLAFSFRRHWHAAENVSRLRRTIKTFGLLALLFVPLALFWAAEPKVYPPINPDTGGPTGNSLLESTLGIILILLVLPYGLGRQARKKRWFIVATWFLFVAENALSFSLGHGNNSHHRWSEILGLGSLLPWLVIMPVYFTNFDWPAESKRWRNACLAWWGFLVVSAWLIFLPGLLDHFKFTDALVGHSHMAMAGFVSSLNIFLLVNLLGKNGRNFNSTWAFYAWQAGTLGYVILMFLAGWLEGNNPAFTIIPGAGRNIIYLLRLVCGGLMTTATIHWWQRLTVAVGHQPLLQTSPVAMSPVKLS